MQGEARIVTSAVMLEIRCTTGRGGVSGSAATSMVAKTAVVHDEVRMAAATPV